MKRMILNTLFAVTAITVIPAHAHIYSDEELQAVVGKAAFDEITFFRGENSWWKPVQEFAIPAAVVAGSMHLISRYPDFEDFKKFAPFTGGLAGVSLVLIQYLYRYSQLQKIRKFMHEYAGYTDLQELPKAHGMMVLAALLSDLKTMRSLAPHVTSFLKEDGIWEVLAELYYLNDFDNKVIEGTSKNVGVSSKGGLYAGGTKQTQEIKRKFMEPHVMQRRIKALKAKLGYKD